MYISEEMCIWARLNDKSPSDNLAYFSLGSHNSDEALGMLPYRAIGECFAAGGILFQITPTDEKPADYPCSRAELAKECVEMVSYIDRPFEISGALEVNKTKWLRVFTAKHVVLWVRLSDGLANEESVHVDLTAAETLAWLHGLAYQGTGRWTPFGKVTFMFTKTNETEPRIDEYSVSRYHLPQSSWSQSKTWPARF